VFFPRPFSAALSDRVVHLVQLIRQLAIRGIVLGEFLRIGFDFAFDCRHGRYAFNLLR
jgi:hypothetical protein